MTSLEHILAVHRAERHRAEPAFDAVLGVVALFVYGAWRLIGALS